jgi:hypothetical protein
MPRPSSLALALAMLPLALAAASCSGSTKTAPLGEWVDGLCRAGAIYQTVSDAAGETFARADFSDTKAAKAAFARAIDVQREAQKTFRSSFDDLGQPDIDGGKAVVQAFRDQFSENTKRVDDFANRVAAIPDSADFLTAFDKIADQVEEPDFRGRLEAVARDHPAVNDLIAAIEADPDCASVFFPSDAAASEAEKEAWVSGVCTALNNWVESLSTGADRLSSNVDAAATPADVRQLLVDFFEQGLTDTRNLQRALRRLSPPPVRDGEAIQAVFTDAADDLVAAMERLTREARSLEFTSPAQAIAESDRLISLIEQLFGNVATSFDALQQYDPEGLETYFQTLPECQL